MALTIHVRLMEDTSKWVATKKREGTGTKTSNKEPCPQEMED